MQDVFYSPVHGHHYSLRCFPMDRSCQTIRNMEWQVSPGSINGWGFDSFGNRVLTGKCEETHLQLQVSVKATVCTDGGECIDSRQPYQLGMFRYETPLTKMGIELEKFYQEKNFVGIKNVWERTIKWMNYLAHVFQYEKYVTTAKTTAEQAFAGKKGVCQDYAHILLSLCRKEGMVARYVAGCIPGEGETHAWVEVYQNGIWKGFDPTNNRMVDEDYICFAVGRDASDCPLNRGIYFGNPEQKMNIYVKMEEITC